MPSDQSDLQHQWETLFAPGQPVDTVDPDDLGNFPRDPWSRLPIQQRTDEAAWMRKWSRVFAAQHCTPRRNDVALAFLDAHPPTGRILLYPAGDLARRVHQRFQSQANIVGFVDRRGPSTGPVQGVPVFAPDRLDVAYDCLLVCHAFGEAYFAEEIERLGVKKEKILKIFLAEDFASWWASEDRTDMSLAGLPHSARPVRNVVIRTSLHINVIDDRELARVLDSDDTVLIYVGPLAGNNLSEYFRFYQTGGSLPALRHLLDIFHPKSIYISSVIADNYWGYIVRDLYPHARLIHEIYDWSFLFPNEPLRPLHYASHAEIEASHLGELVSVRHADAVVSKRSGPCWALVQKEFRAPYARYFQSATRPSTPRPPARPQSEGNRLRLVYAGPVPPPSELDDWSFYGFVPLLERLMALDFVSLDIFNSMDGGRPVERIKFQRYYEEFNGSEHHYHHSLPHGVMVDTIQDYDFGWMCINRSEQVEQFPDTHTVVSARVTGYISAGLPVIVDDTWNATVDLIRRFNAGIVIPEPTPDRIEAALRGINPMDYKPGALALRDYMLSENQRMVNALKSLVDSWS
jgi:hypothetical protein